MLHEYKIENTTEGDLEFIFWLFEEAIAYQKRKKYNIWKNYNKDLLRNEMQNKTQYKIVIDKKIALVFSVVYNDKLLWNEREKGDSIYLHRIVVNPEFKGHRLFGVVLEWSIRHAENRDLQFVRMDTWASNPNIIKYYESFGFRFIGNRTTPNSPELPIQHRGLDVALLEFHLDKTKTFNSTENKMLYMVIESFHHGKVKEIYQRFDEKGRLMPEGLKYVNSWINEEVTKCYQVMECDDDSLLKEWISRWNDLADFEIVPVITSAKAKEKVLQK
jgi:ribosomal protein S18 acetylase RimI-like enzyme